MATMHQNITSPFINNIAASIFGVQQQYIDDLMKIKKLMNKSKLGILSEQLFIILKQKYPQEYRYLLMEQNNPQEITIVEEEKKEDKNTTAVVKKEKIEKENQQASFENWIHLYGRP